MNQPSQVFRRPPTGGWIVISGSLPTFGSESPQLAERLLERVDLSATPMCLSMGKIVSKDLRLFLDDVETLLDAPVALILVQNVAELEYEEVCATAGLILLMGGQAQDWIRALGLSESYLRLERMLEESGLVLATGPAASALGSWVITDIEEKPIPGLGWLHGAVVLPEVQDPIAVPGVKRLISQHELSYALGIPQGAILALGPNGEVEVWGETPPVIALGRGWVADER